MLKVFRCLVLLLFAQFFFVGSCLGQIEESESKRILKNVKELLRQKKPEKAITILKDSIKSDSKNAIFWVALGFSYEAANLLKEALEAFKNAQTLQPSLRNVGLRILVIEQKLKKQGNASQTETQSESPLSETQKKARELFARAKSEKLDGKFESAFEKFIECVELDPDYLGGNDDGFIEAGLNYYAQRIKEKDKNAIYFFCIFKDFFGDYDSAERGLRKFLDLKPSKEMVAKATERLKLVEEHKKRAAIVLASPKPKEPLKKIQKGTVSNPPVETASSAPNSLASTSSDLLPLENPQDMYKDLPANELLERALEMKENNDNGNALKLLALAARKSKDPRVSLALGDSYLEAG
ncbi:tetratricopeptide repeat protein, partial [bacterium]|nr:tetratricopeptide repeat protein [bacterium]